MKIVDAVGEGAPSDALLETLSAYHDGELSRFRRWRFERTLAGSEVLQRELAALELMGHLAREHEGEADAPDLWASIAARLPAENARAARGKEAGGLRERWGLGNLAPYLKPLAATAAAAGAIFALVEGWGIPSAPVEGRGGVVRWMDSGGRNVMVLEDDADTQMTVIWLLDEGVDGAARGGRNGMA